MEIIRKKVCMDDYVSHLPGKIPCIEYNGNLSGITAFPDADGGNMSHIVCNLLLVSGTSAITIIYLEALDKYRYVKNIVENNILLKPTSGYGANISAYAIGDYCPNTGDTFTVNPYFTGGTYLAECENIDPYSCELLLDTKVHKVNNNKYYKSDDNLTGNSASTYILVSAEEEKELDKIVTWWNRYINFVGGRNNFIEYFKDYTGYINHCTNSAVTDSIGYMSYQDCFKFCLDFERLFLGYYKTPERVYNGCNEEVPTEVYTILASQYKEIYKHVENFEIFENFIDKISDVENEGAIPVPVNEGIIRKDDFWKESTEDYEDGAYFVAPYIEIPLCLESDFVDEGLYSLYENTTEESQYLFIGSGQTNSGNCNPNSSNWITNGFGLNNGNGIDVVSPIFEILDKSTYSKIDYTTPYKFENENVQGLLRENVENLVYCCSASTNSGGTYDVLVDNGSGIYWKCKSINVYNVPLTGDIKETIFLSDIPYRNDFSQTDGTEYYIQPSYLNGCKTIPNFLSNSARNEGNGLFGLDEKEVILPIFCNLGNAVWSAITTNKTLVRYKSIGDNNHPTGVYEETINWHAEKIHTSVFGQETDLWVAKYEFETSKDEDKIHMAKLLAYEYKSTSESTENEYFFDPALNGLLEEPKVDIDVSIDRGSGAAWEKHFKLMECNTLEDLENYGNNYFNIRDL